MSIIDGEMQYNISCSDNRKKESLHICIVRKGRKNDLGDNIRIRKIYEVLVGSDFKVSEIILPTFDSSADFLDILRSITFYGLPPKKPIKQATSGTLASLRTHVGYTVMLNYLISRLEKLKPDLVLAETSPVGWIAVEAAKKRSVPCLIDAHGLSFAETKGSGIEGWNEIASLERTSFESCDHLFVVSERMKKFISKNFCIPNKKITVASNGGTIRNCHARYNVPMNVVYAGIFAYWEKIEDLLDVAKAASSKEFKFTLAGNGPLKSKLLGRVEEEHIPIEYLGFVPKEKIQDLLLGMQVGIAPSTNDLARQVASPIKVFDYLSCGLPVITPKIGDWGDLVEAEDCGIALKDDSIEGYLSALEKLHDPDTWETKSKNALNAIHDKYNWNKTLAPISHIISRF